MQGSLRTLRANRVHDLDEVDMSSVPSLGMEIPCVQSNWAQEPHWTLIVHTVWSPAPHTRLQAPVLQGSEIFISSTCLGWLHSRDVVG